jgi:hypothetical protein
MSDDDSASSSGITRQAKGIFVGAIFIAWGIIGALWSYFDDTNSFDITRMMDAAENAVVHAVIWIGVGGCVIAWYTLGSGSSRRDGTDDNDYNQRGQFR